MQQVRDFIDRNPNEVVVLEYGDYDGNPEITGRTTIFRLNKYLAGRMLERPDPNAPWPTLGQMIDHRKQVVVFSGRYRDSTKNVPNWFIDRRPYIEGSWSYTRYGTSTKDLMNDFTRHASNTPADTRLWQCIDYGYDVSVGNVILSSIGLAHKCLEDVANDSYPRLKDVAKLYSDKFVHVHRIRVDFYYKYLNDFRNLVQSVNAKNVQRYRASINYQ
ncbi:hypothetical protein BDF22DRAFT_671564 [Syncephalis plumigaleata]|nr:hypothetical protein BDF22DRAFT_671564 [Syncephalis plumigaleata]